MGTGQRRRLGGPDLITDEVNEDAIGNNSVCVCVFVCVCFGVICTELSSGGAYGKIKGLRRKSNVDEREEEVDDGFIG